VSRTPLAVACRQVTEMASGLEAAVEGEDWDAAAALESRLAIALPPLCSGIDTADAAARQALIQTLGEVQSSYDRCLAGLVAERSRVGRELAGQRHGYRSAGSYLSVAGAA
jgi:hypothetical protein